MKGRRHVDPLGSVHACWRSRSCCLPCCCGPLFGGGGGVVWGGAHINTGPWLGDGPAGVAAPALPLVEGHVCSQQYGQQLEAMPPWPSGCVLQGDWVGCLDTRNKPLTQSWVSRQTRGVPLPVTADGRLDPMHGPVVTAADVERKGECALSLSGQVQVPGLSGCGMVVEPEGEPPSVSSVLQRSQHVKAGPHCCHRCRPLDRLRVCRLCCSGVQGQVLFGRTSTTLAIERHLPA